MNRRRTLGLAAGLVAFICTACGVPGQDQPQKVERPDVPFGLTKGQSEPRSPTTTRAPG
jgi:hypothetical protein